MAERYYRTDNGGIDLAQVVAVTGDSFHTTVVFDGGTSIAVPAHYRELTEAWLAYKNRERVLPGRENAS